MFSGTLGGRRQFAIDANIVVAAEFAGQQSLLTRSGTTGRSVRHHFHPQSITRGSARAIREGRTRHLQDDLFTTRHDSAALRAQRFGLLYGDDRLGSSRLLDNENWKTETV